VVPCTSGFVPFSVRPVLAAVNPVATVFHRAASVAIDRSISSLSWVLPIVVISSTVQQELSYFLLLLSAISITQLRI
jgi:hypothetical protein